MEIDLAIVCLNSFSVQTGKAFFGALESSSTGGPSCSSSSEIALQTKRGFLWFSWLF